MRIKSIFFFLLLTRSFSSLCLSVTLSLQNNNINAPANDVRIRNGHRGDIETWTVATRVPTIRIDGPDARTENGRYVQYCHIGMRKIKGGRDGEKFIKPYEEGKDPSR